MNLLICFYRLNASYLGFFIFFGGLYYLSQYNGVGFVLVLVQFLHLFLLIARSNLYVLCL
jgi:hypothetical protein